MRNDFFSWDDCIRSVGLRPVACLRRSVAGMLLLGSWLSLATLHAADNPQPDPTSQPIEAPTAARTDVKQDEWMQQQTLAAAPSVVMITVEGRDGRQAGLGTGFVVDPQGLIATNLHVIGEARPIAVRFADGREFPVTEIHASDRQLDLAVVRIAAHDLKPLHLADDNNSPPQGTPVLALGNPMGLRHSVVTGIVSGTREIDGRTMIQIAIPIEPGNSGGPLLDRHGEVHGIVTMKSAVTANLGFAVEISALKGLLQRPNPIAIERWKTIGTLPARDWQNVFGARWQQRAGQIVVSEPGESFGGRALCLWQHDLPPVPFEVATFVKLDNEEGAAGLVFFSDGQDRHYGFYPSAGRLRFTFFDGPSVYSWRILDELSSPHYRPGEWNHLKVRLEADHKVRCFVNDQQILERTIELTSGGRVGLAKFRDTQASFKQFRVAPEIAASQLADHRLAPLRGPLSELQLSAWTPQIAKTPFVADATASRHLLEERAAQLLEQSLRYRQLASDIHVLDVCHALQRVLSETNQPVDLGRAALLVARLDNPELDVDAYVGQLDRMAEEVRSKLPAGAPAEARWHELKRYLFEEGGYHGSRTNYYQAANSYLNQVIDDREGLPITLTILTMELARRIDLSVDGIGLPGHFVARVQRSESDRVIVDPFDGGTTIVETTVQRWLADAAEESEHETFLAPMTPRAIIERMLRNLQGIAQQAHDQEAHLRYLEALVMLDPDEPTLRGVRAVVRHETGRKQAAIDDLDWFLERHPPGIDPAAIEQLRNRFLEGLVPAAMP